MAAESGAELMIKSNVTNVKVNSENRIAGLKVSTHKGDLTIDCNLVIDASGFSSSVARQTSE